MAVTFLSKNKRHRIVIEPIRNQYGRDGVVGTTKGKTIEFKDYRYVSMSAEETQQIRDSWSFNREVWEPGNAPGAMKPSVEEMLAQITDATAYQRVEKLRELKTLETVGDGELGGHNRSDVLTALDRALGILTEGREGKRGAGKPQPVPKALSEAEVHKQMTKPA